MKTLRYLVEVGIVGAGHFNHLHADHFNKHIAGAVAVNLQFNGIDGAVTVQTLSDNQVVADADELVRLQAKANG